MRCLNRRLLTPRRSSRSGPCWLVLYIFISCLVVLGAFQAVSILLDLVALLFPDEVQWAIDHWGHSDQPKASLVHWPTDASRNVIPVPCHSHNDYWRRVPLYLAVQAGCTSVEVDVWLFDQELFVGHSESSLTPDRTLRELYIKPLRELINQQNQDTRFAGTGSHSLGVFDTDPSQTLVLLIDFKNQATELYDELVKQLSPLRQDGLLTYFNGTAIVKNPITIVVTGDAPFELVVANETYRDLFFDAPLQDLADLSYNWPNPNRTPSYEHSAGPARRSPTMAGDTRITTTRQIPNSDPDSFTWENSYYGSTSFTSAVGSIKGSRLSQLQLQILRAQIHGAHRRGLKARYWDVPSWPTGLRNHIWHILIREGVDVLSVDDLIGATRRDWRKRKGWWF